MDRQPRRSGTGQVRDKVQRICAAPSGVDMHRWRQLPPLQPIADLRNLESTPAHGTSLAAWDGHMNGSLGNGGRALRRPKEVPHVEVGVGAAQRCAAAGTRRAKRAARRPARRAQPAGTTRPADAQTRADSIYMAKCRGTGGPGLQEWTQRGSGRYTDGGRPMADREEEFP